MAIFKAQDFDTLDTDPPPAPRLYPADLLEFARRLAEDGVIILNPENLHPQTIYDIDMDWWRDVTAHRSRVHWRAAQLRKSKRDAARAAAEKGGHS